MYEYIKGLGSIWVSPEAPPASSKNILWLKQSGGPTKRYSLLYYNVYKSLSRWENVTPGYVLFEDIRGIAEPGPDFYPVTTNDYIAYIGSGAGEYTNFIQENGKPITITSNTSIVILYKEKDSKYWTYKETECKGPQGDSAYELAKLGGYTKTKEEFYRDLAQVSNKVDKIPGKGLSTNDYTDHDKNLVRTIPDKVNREELTQVAFSGLHKDLLDTNSVDCHPIEAITGLRQELDSKQPIGSYAHLDENGKVLETANNSDKLNNKVESELHVNIADKAIGDEDGLNIKINYAKKTEVEDSITDVSYNSSSGVWTFTKSDGTIMVIDQPIEQIIKEGYYDATTEEIVLVMWDESEIRIPAEALVNIYTGVNTDSTNINISSDNVISVAVKDYVSKTYTDNQLATKEDKSKLKALAYKETADYNNDVSNKPKLNGNIIQAENTTESLGLEHNIVSVGVIEPTEEYKEVWVDMSDIDGTEIPLLENAQYQALLTEAKTIINAINELVIKANQVTTHTKRIAMTTNKPSLETNRLYVWETPITTLYITLVPPAQTGIVNEYLLQFSTGDLTPVVTFTPEIKWANSESFTPQKNKTYQIRILEGIGVYSETT